MPSAGESEVPASPVGLVPSNIVEQPLSTTATKPDAKDQVPLKTMHHSCSNNHTTAESVFECNICLELASEPVVTLCGHLYCWSCLYRWMNLQVYTRACPVCKAGVEIDKVIPIYGRGSDAEARQEQPEEQPLPPRPQGQRLPPVQISEPQAAAGVAAQPAQPQQGMLPALFGFQLGPGQGYVEALTPEQQHQAFLSRLLLMLGSFVIMCLLLF